MVELKLTPHVKEMVPDPQFDLESNLEQDVENDSAMFEIESVSRRNQLTGNLNDVNLESPLDWWLNLLGC